MNSPRQTLIVGIGSRHGDDQAGWSVIDSLAGRISSQIRLRKAAVPHDIIDWLDECDVLHLVDGCQVDETGSEETVSDETGNTVHRFDVVMSPVGVELQESVINTVAGNVNYLTRPPQLRSGSSHQIDVIAVLKLADRLSSLPKRVVLWAVPAEHFDPVAEMSSASAAGVQDCVNRISAELGSA